MGLVRSSSTNPKGNSLPGLLLRRLAQGITAPGSGRTRLRHSAHFGISHHVAVRADALKMFLEVQTDL